MKKLFGILLLLTIAHFSIQQTCVKGQFANERNNNVCTTCPKGCTACAYNFFACSDNNCGSCSECEEGYTLKQEGFSAYCNKDVNVGVILGVVFGSLAVCGLICFCVCAQQAAEKKRKRKKFQKSLQYSNPG
jgi:hypothetical protein